VAAAISHPNVQSGAFINHTRHTVALRLLPFLFLMYIVNYLDRISLAYAAIGMSRDVGFNDRVIGLGIGVFFVSYVALQIPGALLVERWSARRMISLTLLAWGSLTALTALVHTPMQLYLARFVLGAAEAGFFPGVVVYLSHWFIRADRAKATSNFMAAIPLSFIIGSPLAGWILGHHWFGLEGWRLLFVLEGAPAVVLGVVAYFVLTDWPHEAEWLTPEQRGWLAQELEVENAEGLEKATVWQVLRSRLVLWLAAATFVVYFANYSFLFWFPSMLKRASGFSDMRVGLLGAIPFVVMFFAMQVNGWDSDRTGERHWHAAGLVLVAAGGALGLLSQPHSMAMTMVFFTMLSLSTGYLPVFWAIPTEALSQSTAAAAVGFINAIGSIAGFAGPYLFGYLNTRTGSSSAGIGMLLIFVVAGGLMLGFAPRKEQVAG
jgi:ACS family tartrate transporter-like MFS transporter